MASFLQLQCKNEANIILHNKQVVGSCNTVLNPQVTDNADSLL